MIDRPKGVAEVEADSQMEAEAAVCRMILEVG